MLSFYSEPKLHFNTVSTLVRILEEKGFVGHEVFGNTYHYYPIVSREEYHKGMLHSVISKCFNNSYMSTVSALVKEENITVVTIQRSVSPELDAEALRIINAMSTWKPGRQDEQPVDVNFMLPVMFRLDKNSKP